MKYLILALLASFSITASAGKPTKDQVVQPDEATTVKSPKSNSSDNRLHSNPTVTQGLKASREMAADTNIGPAASPKAPVPKVDSINLNSSRSNIYREKAPNVTPGPTPSKEGSNAEPDKPFKF